MNKVVKIKDENTVQETLQEAMSYDLKNVLIIGSDGENIVDFANNDGENALTKQHALWLIENVKMNILQW